MSIHEGAIPRSTKPPENVFVDRDYSAPVTPEHLLEKLDAVVIGGPIRRFSRPPGTPRPAAAGRVSPLAGAPPDSVFRTPPTDPTGQSLVVEFGEVVAVMTIHKLTAGDGYTYLTRQIAGGDVQRERSQDAADYYTAKGNLPGRWQGRGAPLLGLEGEQVTEDQMRALFGMGLHPDADAMISDYLAEHVRPGMTERQVAAVQAKALRAASLGAAFPEYKPIERFDKRVHQRLEVIEQETGRALTAAEVKRVHAEEARRARAAVAGFDVVFAPVKSTALLWALDPRPEVRQAVRQAHEAARDAAMEMLEEHAAFTRTGKGGVAQIETRGLIAAVFDHYDSRAGDPNLHTHIAISSKVQGVDGKWCSLDARALCRITVAVSEFYNTAFETELRRRLPVTFVERPDTAGAREPIREIAGIPVEFIEHFSSRRTDIETRYEQLLRAFRREHGHDPSRQVCHQRARQANPRRQESSTLACGDALRLDAVPDRSIRAGGDRPARGRRLGRTPDRRSAGHRGRRGDPGEGRRGGVGRAGGLERGGDALDLDDLESAGRSRTPGPRRAGVRLPR
jgi:conjugative relaxase-like TrwC/TraI family protein